MSDYVRKKAVRYKLNNAEQYFKDKDYQDTDDIAEYFNQEKEVINTKYGNEKNNLNIGSGLNYETNEYEYFIDFILDYEYGASGDFEDVRELTKTEYDKYKEIFKKVVSNIKPEELRLVHYCYYNGADEPAVWNLEEI